MHNGGLFDCVDGLDRREKPVAPPRQSLHKRGLSAESFRARRSLENELAEHGPRGRSVASCDLKRQANELIFPSLNVR